MFDRVSSYGAISQRNYMNQQMMSQLNVLTDEVSSGRKANPEGALGQAASLLYSLHMQSDQQTALQTSITTASQRMETIQTALSGIADSTQNVITQALQAASPGHDPSVVGSQAQAAMASVLNSLNMTLDGAAVFGGDNIAPPMQAADAVNGPQATINALLSSAVGNNGGPLTASDINNFINGPNGINSVFNDTNSVPGYNYGAAFVATPSDGQPTKVLIGATQTLQYNASADQPGIRDLLKGLSMLSLLSAPSSQLDDSAKQALLQQATSVMNTAQTEMTNLQGALGATQSQLQNASNLQKSASAATQQQILTYEQADTTTDATSIAYLQQQLQASFTLTARISQLSMVNYMPTVS